MVNPGKDCPKTYTCDEIGEATVAVLRRVMPAAMPVITMCRQWHSLQAWATRGMHVVAENQGASKCAYCSHTCVCVRVQGVNFLSGGQSLENAAARLNAINKHKGNSPWNLSFSVSATCSLIHKRS